MSRAVNLNKVRKDRARHEARGRADRNAVRFGQTKAERERLKAEATKRRAALEDHKRER
jgi:Domain of unknown function (DUF4169)